MLKRDELHQRARKRLIHASQLKLVVRMKYVSLMTNLSPSSLESRAGGRTHISSLGRARYPSRWYTAWPGELPWHRRCFNTVRWNLMPYVAYSPCKACIYKTLSLLYAIRSPPQALCSLPLATGNKHRGGSSEKRLPQTSSRISKVPLRYLQKLHNPGWKGNIAYL